MSNKSVEKFKSNKDIKSKKTTYLKGSIKTKNAWMKIMGWRVEDFALKYPEYFTKVVEKKKTPAKKTVIKKAAKLNVNSIPVQLVRKGLDWMILNMELTATRADKNRFVGAGDFVSAKAAQDRENEILKTFPKLKDFENLRDKFNKFGNE